MNEQDRELMIDHLVNLIVNINDKETCKEVFDTLVTKTECIAVAQRLETARLLKKNLTFSEIVDKTDISSYLIPRIKTLMQENESGFDLALEKMENCRSYTAFAEVYDILMQDLEYEKRLKFIINIFEKFNTYPKLVLDLACGTGTMTTLLAERGYDMTGIDISAEMLDIAKQKAEDKKLDILYLNQEMQNFELYGSVQAVLCLLDSLNYLTEKEDLEQTFRLVNNYLEPGGLFIFDVNTKHKLENVLAGNVFTGGDEGIFYTWENVYDPEEEICEFTLNFFVKEDTLYRRYSEIHYQRAYTSRQLINLLKKTGFEILAQYDDLTFDKPVKNSEKVFYIARKPIK